MKPVAFDICRRRRRRRAAALLAQSAGDAKPIAGGQSLGPMLNLRLAHPAALVDVSRAADMRTARDEGDAIIYGGAVTHAEIEDGVVPDATPGWLAPSRAGSPIARCATAAPSAAVSPMPIRRRTGSMF